MAETIKPLGGLLAAAVTGIDVGALTADGIDVVRNALARHHVVVLRGQEPSDDDLRHLARALGDLAPEPPNFTQPRATAPRRFDRGLYDMDGSVFRASHWHTDLTYMRNPASYGILAADVVPSVGGDTVFVNMLEAHRLQSPAFAQLLASLRAEHTTFPLDQNPIRSVHPVVVRHAATGAPVLYVNPLWVRRILGLTTRESQILLDHLFAVSTTTPEITYRHRWAPGDVLIWDMRTTQHRAVDDYGDEVRMLRRLSVLGELPIGLDGRPSDGIEGDYEWTNEPVAVV